MVVSSWKGLRLRSRGPCTGTAGYTAAFRAAQLGLRVALVDEGPIGGACLHRGCIYRQAARETELETQIEAFERAFAAASHLVWRADSGVLTMTVHQSKGREFDAVILYDASAASFNPADEERTRLFYVAITRARYRWEIIARRGSETRLIDALGKG